METCIPIGELGRVIALPPGDPGRAHLERCSRCRSLADMLLEFARPAAAPPESGFHEADDRLLATIADLTGIPAEQAASTARVDLRRVVITPRRSRWFGFSGVRLAGAAAALVVVSAVGAGLWRAHTAAPVMRSFTSAGAAAFISDSAREVSGGVEFSWSAVPHATTYRVIFLDESLGEIARLAPTSATSVRMETRALPRGLVHGRTVGWMVEALAGGDRLVVSQTRALRLP